MKILHFSDTHLGFQAFDRVTDAGVNAREQDVYDAFEQVVDQIVSLKPELVLHSGDLFHRPSPSNRALTFALEQLRRVSDARIPMVIIAGNHETPKTIYNSPILRALRTLDLVYPVFGERWEKHEFGNVVVHGIPHINDNRLLLEELNNLKAEKGKFNILMLHTSLGRRFLMEEYGEQVFPPEFETKLKDFQYVALGHWHDCQSLSLHPAAWYSGSTERFSDTEIGADKGFLMLELSDKADFSVTFESINTRSWLKWERKKCHAVSVAELETELEAFAKDNTIQDAIVSLNFLDIKPEQALELSNMRLRQLFPEVFQLIPKRKTFSDREFVHSLEANQFGSLDQVFGDYLRSKYTDDKAQAEKLVEVASRYFGE
ncbi:MAG: DNA repair exonuclease [Saprospiraceae bacterium]